MKKVRLFTLLALISILALLVLVGCKKEDRIVSVSLKDHDPDSAIEIAVGDFDFDDYTVVVSYESETTEEITLSEEMIEETDLFKFYQIGDHEITLSYEEHQYVFKISVKRETFGHLSFPENPVFTYDGKAHVVEVDGDIPANAVITYLGGNSFVNAGSYKVTAVVSCEGYVTERLSTTVKIKRATYDMSGVTFEAKEFVYDGKTHSVAISGKLPEGVSSPTYRIGEKETSGAVDVGEYRVLAIFENKDPNYETIPDMETTLSILPAKYTVKGMDIVFKKAENGKVIDGESKIYDGFGVTFDLDDYGKLSNKIAVSFSVYDKNGEMISSSNTKTNIVNAGLYTVMVEFTLSNGQNYEPIEPLVRRFEVKKAPYTITGITMSSNYLEYDGAEHFLQIAGKLPENVSVEYEYYIGSTRIVDEHGEPVRSVRDAGRYTVKAVFTHTDENRAEIAPITATLNIQKIMADISAVGFLNGTIIECNDPLPQFKTWKEASNSEYDFLSYGIGEYYVLNSRGEYVKMAGNLPPSDAGFYKYVITVTLLKEYENNYILPEGGTSQTLSFDFEIRKKEIAMPEVTFESAAMTEYTGEAQAVTFRHNADLTVSTVSTVYYQWIDGSFVAMERGKIPTNAGRYKAVVTIALQNDECYVFSNGETSVEFSFEFEIKKKLLLDVTAVFGSIPTYEYNGRELTYRTVENLDYAIREQLSCVASVIMMSSGQDWTTMYYVEDPGYYYVQYYLAVKDSDNFYMLQGDREIALTYVDHYFYVK